MQSGNVLIILSIFFSMSYTWNTDYDDYDGSTYVMPYNHFDDDNQRHHCNCIKVRNCLPIVAKLYRYSKPQRQTIIKELRTQACGFIGTDPMVCCTTTEDNGKTTEKPWVWDAVKHDAAYFKSPFSNHFDRRHNFIPFYPDIRTMKRNLFDFEDPNTFRNCPRRFSPHFPIPPHIQHAKPFHGKKWNPNRMPFDDDNAIDGSGSTGAHKSRPLNPVKFPADDATKMVNSEDCGASISSRLIGGDATIPGQFPWMARLAYRNRTSQLVAYRCLGSLIGNKYVLTAAHCVINLVEDLELVYVTLGDSDVRSIPCNLPTCPDSNDFEIESVIYHPAYDTPKYANDIALLQLRISSASVTPAPLCLPAGQYENGGRDAIGQNGIIAGWGGATDNDEGKRPVLQQISLAIVNNTECANFYARFSANTRDPIIISSSQICAQGSANRDACQGDSGGPLMQIHRSGRYTLNGLVSFGPRQCGIPNFPGVYTRVSRYIDWIVSNMRL